MNAPVTSENQVCPKCKADYLVSPTLGSYHVCGNPLDQRDGTEFSWRGLFNDMRHGRWEFGWDSRKPLPGWGGWIYLWYDGPHYALRLWRLYVALD